MLKLFTFFFCEVSTVFSVISLENKKKCVYDFYCEIIIFEKIIVLNSNWIKSYKRRTQFGSSQDELYVKHYTFKNSTS